MDDTGSFLLSAELQNYSTTLQSPFVCLEILKESIACSLMCQDAPVAPFLAVGLVTASLQIEAGVLCANFAQKAKLQHVHIS